MYRPEGIDREFHLRYRGLVRSEGDNLLAKPYLLLNAGADAMLEGLKKAGTIGDFYNCTRIDVKGVASPPLNSKSYLVFIPKE